MPKNKEYFLYNLPSLVWTVAICNNRVALRNKEAVAICNNYPKEHEKISLEANFKVTETHHWLTKGLCILWVL